MATKKVRVLSDLFVHGTLYRPNSVLVLDAAFAKPLVEAGYVDDNKAAVAYCETELGVAAVDPTPPLAETPAAGEGG